VTRRTRRKIAVLKTKIVLDAVREVASVAGLAPAGWYGLTGHYRGSKARGSRRTDPIAAPLVVLNRGLSFAQGQRHLSQAGRGVGCARLGGSARTALSR